MTRLKNWIAIAVAAIAVAIVVVISAINWHAIGDNSGIDLNGWIALVLGVVVTLAIGVGLMTLIFVSSRLGYDESRDDDKGEKR